MSGSFFYEGNGYFDYSSLTNSSIGNSKMSRSTITTTSIDMLDIVGNYQNIINVKNPINPQDAATKLYVDNLGIILSTATLIGTANTTISDFVKGSYIITISNLIFNGPSAIFHISKSESIHDAHIVSTVANPGYQTNIFLQLTWPQNSGILLKKSGNSFDGSYKIKML